MSEAPQLAQHHEVEAAPISAWRYFLYINRVEVAFVGYLVLFLAVLQPGGVALVLMGLSLLIMLVVLMNSFIRARDEAGK